MKQILLREEAYNSFFFFLLSIVSPLVRYFLWTSFERPIWQMWLVLIFIQWISVLFYSTLHLCMHCVTAALVFSTVTLSLDIF